MKIIIYGNPGSGKSTLAVRLQQLLNIPLYHLDQYFWRPNWQEPVRAEYEKIHNNLCDLPEWIIDGVSTTTLEYRIQKADIVIFLDVSRYVCLYRVFKRALLNYGKVNFSSAAGCSERGPDMKFLKFIWNFDSNQKIRALALFEKYKNCKSFFIIKNKTELDKITQLLITLTK
jgi:adenylate kinase family enzyme